MSIHIIIDGYNLIRQSKYLSTLDLQDIQLGRDALIDMLVAYKKIKAHRITVVFDGIRAPNLAQQRDRHKGISIMFSHHGESADAVIKKMASGEKQKALVVSSDQDIIQSANSSGASTISSVDFENKLILSAHMDGMEPGRDDHDGWKPTTKKKGPSRRLTRRQRKNNAKICKL
ncbi:MAG: NYN domain-containing protein [Desulfobacterales bacterium]